MQGGRMRRPESVYQSSHELFPVVCAFRDASCDSCVLDGIIGQLKAPSETEVRVWEHVHHVVVLLRVPEDDERSKAYVVLSINTAADVV